MHNFIHIPRHYEDHSSWGMSKNSHSPQTQQTTRHKCKRDEGVHTKSVIEEAPVQPLPPHAQPVLGIPPIDSLNSLQQSPSTRQFGSRTKLTPKFVHPPPLPNTDNNPKIDIKDLRARLDAMINISTALEQDGTNLRQNITDFEELKLRDSDMKTNLQLLPTLENIEKQNAFTDENLYQYAVYYIYIYI